MTDATDWDAKAGPLPKPGYYMAIYSKPGYRGRPEMVEVEELTDDAVLVRCMGDPVDYPREHWRILSPQIKGTDLHALAQVRLYLEGIQQHGHEFEGEMAAEALRALALVAGS